MRLHIGDHMNVPAPELDPQLYMINQARKDIQYSELPPTATTTRINPLQAVVEFSYNNKKELCILGPYTPGERDVQRPPIRLATDYDKVTFAPQLALFMQGQDQMKTGTLLDLLFPQNKPKVQSYYKAGIYSVEHLASANDSVRNRHNFTVDDVKLAQRFLNYQHYEKELQIRDEMIAKQRAEIELLKAQLGTPQHERTRARI